MSDFSAYTGWAIPEGNAAEVADASGNMLWSATIKFTINGDTYIADRGMTWAEWFASDYNTTGETEGDIKDANGNEVSMDAVIVGGTAYEVGFAPSVVEVTINFAANVINAFNNNVCAISINGETVTPPFQTSVAYSLNVGDTMTFSTVMMVAVMASINGEAVQTAQVKSYTYSVKSNATMQISVSSNVLFVDITET